MKPFNLEAAKAGKPVVTRDGNPARIICFDANRRFPLIALVASPQVEGIYTYTEGGRYSSGGRDSSYDLWMKEDVTRTKWVTLIKQPLQPVCALVGLSDSKEDAENAGGWFLHSVHKLEAGEVQE